MSEDEIKMFLRKKGYNQDTIKQAFSDDQELQNRGNNKCKMY